MEAKEINIIIDQLNRVHRDMNECANKFILKDAIDSLSEVAPKEEKAIQLLKMAKCPIPNCDNNGTIAYQTSNGEWEPEPCQWCDEKEKLTSPLS